VFCSIQYALNAVSPTGHYMYHQFNIPQILRSAHTAVFVCFVWISEQAAIISLYNINSLVFITETECVYRAVKFTLRKKWLFPIKSFIMEQCCSCTDRCCMRCAGVCSCGGEGISHPSRGVCQERC